MEELASEREQGREGEMWFGGQSRRCRLHLDTHPFRPARLLASPALRSSTLSRPSANTDADADKMSEMEVDSGVSILGQLEGGGSPG
jgi:hypothetical protein